MKVEREDITKRATELGLTLTEEQIAQHIKDGTLPEKQKSREENIAEHLKKFENDQRGLVVQLLDTKREAMEYRHERNEFKKQLEDLTGQLQEVGDLKAKLPKVEEQLTALKTAEKQRREARLKKIEDENKRTALGYLLNPEAVTAGQFDETIEYLTVTKGKGSEAGLPGGTPPEKTLEDKLAEASKAGSTAEIIAIKRQIMARDVSKVAEPAPA